LSEPVVLGIDDTDDLQSRGTGHTARLLAEAIETAGMGHSLGVTRHQLFAGHQNNATRHNSAAAIAVDTKSRATVLEAFATGFLLREAAAGSDPGLALLSGPLPSAILHFARRAQAQVVLRSEAERLARTGRVRLVPVAGSGAGVIGALCAAALRADGNDGRYIGLPGIRDLVGRVAVSQVLELTPISAVRDEAGGAALEPTAILETGDWVRPRLIDGRPVLVVKRDDRDGLWVTADVPSSKD
jgi:hypothetical protein